MHPRVEAPARRPRQRRLLRIMVGIGVVGAALAALLFNPHALYERTHDVPNPYWGLFNGTYSYTPQQGLPSPDLLDTPPDTVVLHYIRDYISVAGTYPCAQDLAGYADLDLHVGDPVLLGHVCSVHRPVADVAALEVSVGRRGTSIDASRAMVTVRYRVAYADGEAWTAAMQLFPERRQGYFAASIHLNCWDSLETLLLYPRIVSTVPRGIQYVDGSTERCSA